VTDRSSTKPSQPSPDAIRRSLRALADGSAPGRRRVPADAGPTDPSAPPPESVVRDAERAAADALAAAAFLTTGRLPHLDAAITAVAARGDDALAERGRTARESLRRLGAALNGHAG
jgi:hypothetical protein